MNLIQHQKVVSMILKLIRQWFIVIGVYGVYVYDAHHNSNEQRGIQMKIIIKNASDQPLYQQIKDQIKDAILSNEVHEGELLPSIRSLANDLQVSVLTTKRVYAELESEGYIITKVGKGTYVASENLELLAESKRLMVESKLTEVWKMSRSLGIDKEELYSMMDLLFEEEDV